MEKILYKKFFLMLSLNSMLCEKISQTKQNKQVPSE